MIKMCRLIKFYSAFTPSTQYVLNNRLTKEGFELAKRMYAREALAKIRGGKK